MNTWQHSPQATAVVAATAQASERTLFIRRTYVHLAGAIGAFALLEALLVNAPFAPTLVGMMLGTRFSWLIVLGLFMGVGYIANMWAQKATSPAMAYAGLALYVIAEAIIFLPLLYIAAHFAPGVIAPAGLCTLTLVAGLTGTVFITKKDFSFMSGFLMVGGFVALGVIVAGVLFGFKLGLWFAGAMVLLSGGYILYYTSNVLHHYRTDQHVSASLALFAAVALMFYYILMLFLGNRR